MIEISEKDIYIFVFYPELLPVEKKEFISMHYVKYESEIDLLKKMKENLKKLSSDEIVAKVIQKIAKHSTSNVIVLEKMVIKDDEEFLTLAADSPIIEDSSTTDTYKDNKNTYICKIISTRANNKIYIFPSNQNKEFELKLTLFPSRETHIINSSDLPLLVSPHQKINKIHLVNN